MTVDRISHDKLFAVVYSPRIAPVVNRSVQERTAVGPRGLRTDEDDDFVDASPAERVGMIWELTAELWSLQGKDCAQQRLQRHVAKLNRPRR